MDVTVAVVHDNRWCWRNERLETEVGKEGRSGSRDGSSGYLVVVVVVFVSVVVAAEGGRRKWTELSKQASKASRYFCRVSSFHVDTSFQHRTTMAGVVAPYDHLPTTPWP